MAKDEKPLGGTLPDPPPANHDSDEVMVQRGEDAVAVYVLSLGWDGPHTQVFTYKLAEQLPAGASEQEIEQAVEKTKNSEEYFGTCDACGERVFIGYMFDDVCQGCAPGKYGVVF